MALCSRESSGDEPGFLRYAGAIAPEQQASHGMPVQLRVPGEEAGQVCLQVRPRNARRRSNLAQCVRPRLEAERRSPQVKPVRKLRFYQSPGANLPAGLVGARVRRSVEQL